MKVAVYPAKPFMMVPYWLLFAPVSQGAFKLYVALLYYGNGSGARYPTKRTLAKIVGRCEKMVERYVAELEGTRLLVCKSRRVSSGRQASNAYVLYEPSSVDEIAAWLAGPTKENKRWLKSIKLGQVPRSKRRKQAAGKLHVVGDKLITDEYAKFFQRPAG